MKRSLYLSFSLLLTTTCVLHAAEKPWAIHTIDPSTPSQCGADGIRLADANGDGLIDTVTGWEQSAGERGLGRTDRFPGATYS